jgi:hypothetical protein
MIRSVKDKLCLRVPGICRIPCECSKEYVGQNGRTIKTRRKEHIRQMLQPPRKILYTCIHIYIPWIQKLVRLPTGCGISHVADHRSKERYIINFNNTSVLRKATGYMKEAQRFGYTSVISTRMEISS